jgi:CubicO group peptidase (beta-lactamase class C family)
MLVNRMTGESLAEMLSRRIWQPLGMEHDATWLTDRPGGLEAGYCCINATLRDYGRFGLMFLHRGKNGDTQIVPAKWIGEVTNPQGPQERYGALYPDAFPDSPIGYGYQWWIPAGGDDHPYTAWGLCYQFIYVSPKYNLVIAKTSASQDWASYPGLTEETTAFEAIGRYLENGQ